MGAWIALNFSGEAPLVMEVDGFDFAALPEIVKLREHLKQVGQQLGTRSQTQVLGAEYSKKAAAAWYEKHKDEFCPLKESMNQ